MKTFNPQALSILGLSEIDIRIYLHVLKSGTQSVYRIAKELQISRSTMYGLVTQLVHKGLLAWVYQNNKSKYVSAVEPKDLKHIVDEKRHEANEINDSLHLVQQYIDTTRNTSFFTDVRYFTGAKGLEQIVWNTLESKENAICGYSAFNRNDYLSKQFIAVHRREAQRRQGVNHCIVNEQRFSTGRHYLKEYPLEVRFIPASVVAIKGDIYLYDNVYAMSFFSGNSIFGFEIVNQEFVDVQKSLFNNLWNQAKSLK